MQFTKGGGLNNGLFLFIRENFSLYYEREGCFMNIKNTLKIVGALGKKVVNSKTCKIAVPVASIGCTLLSGMQQKTDIVDTILDSEEFNKKVAEAVEKALNK